ncbi:hypothetical protein J2W97_002237 [Paenibacillus jamilae]|nr:hypothetical protein [Paenibacillus jamilae]
MSLTREQVLAMESGVDLDAMVAEFVFGWTRITGPTQDYHGPVEHGDVLIPPNTSADEALRMMPPKGSIPFTYFVNRHWSKSISGAWTVLGNMKKYTFDLFWSDSRDESEQWVCIFTSNDQKHYKVYGGSAPEAICKAALLAVLNL